MEHIKSAKSKVFLPYGMQLKQANQWYPQELSQEWPHQASALSLGESNIVKYGVSFPLRTGLTPLKETDFPEFALYLPIEDGQVEEVFVSRGVCAVSHGPIGGLCHLKGLYRSLTSYGTGGGIKSFLKTEFCTGDKKEKVKYLCLVENGGISLYAEGGSENHVAYMPEFNISRVIGCSFGLLVLPAKGKDAETEDEKGIYVLTHPIKQISKVLLKGHPECIPYSHETERLLCCENDLCVFWNRVESNKLIVRRLVKAEKKDILQSSTLNSSTCFATHDHFNRPYTPTGSSLFTPAGKSHHKSAMRVNREGATTCYWPTFDFSESTVPGPGLALGFYPPHVCIYDEPELAFTTLFNIDLPKGRWIEPRKVQIVRSERTVSNLALWLLVKHNLYLHGINIDSGVKLTHWALKDVEDFSCPVGQTRLPILVTLSRNGQLKIGWLDDSFNLVSSAELKGDIDRPIASVDCVLFGDKIICSLQDEQSQKGILYLNNYRTNGLIRRCVDRLREELPSSISTKLIAGYMGQNVQLNFNRVWKDFTRVIVNVLLSTPTKERLGISMTTYKTVETLRENLKLTTSCRNYLDNLKSLEDTLVTFLKENFSSEPIPVKAPSIFVKFGNLLLSPRATVAEHPDFETLPIVMKLLLDHPDSVENMEKLAIMKSGEEYFTPLIEILISDVFQRNMYNVQFDWPESVITCMGRTDYLSGLPGYNKFTKDKVFEIFTPYREREDVGEDPPWVNHVLNMRVFSEDRRLEEVCRLLDSASPLTLDIEQRAEMSDHEFVEEQEKHLLQLVQISFSAPVGRSAFTLRTEEKNFANLTSNIHLPKLCLTGKCATKGTGIELNETDLPQTYTAWPTFHNAVASALSVRFTDKPADAWFAYNKAKTNEGPEQAGMILGFGLNGILSSMPPTLRHEHLAKENSYTSMAMLLGLSANLVGTGDISTWKVISLHIGAMLPSCTTELEIPRLATLVAPCALGLLFLGTHNSHIAKVLLGEISKRYSPLSVFGGGNSNNSITNVNIEPNGVTGDRESHSLCSGFGLGFVNLGKARSNPAALEEDGIDGILRRFVVGGPKPANFNISEDEDMYNQFGQTVPSLWEEYRCCHIEEGDNVNVDVTTPSAIIAVSLIYLRSGNEAVLKWLSPPSTLHLLDCVRPDLLMLRSLASILVFEKVSNPDVKWLEESLMPQALRQNALRQPEKQSRIDHESINQAWASIVCGYCLGLAIRFAGTSDTKVKDILWDYTNQLLYISSPESKLSEYFPKNFLESSVCTLLISLSLIHAGTGDIPVLRLCRYLQSKVSATQITVSSNTYGLEMCISMATGILFLGGGRYSLSNDDKSIAVLLAAVFPKWPINATDNRYHLQALRHLYILAAQPRLILPRPMPHGTKLTFLIEYLDGQKTKATAPVLLPPFHLLKKIALEDCDFLPVEFNLPKDLPFLQKIVEGGGVLNLVSKPIGSIKYNFMKKMSWREGHAFHRTFCIDEETVTSEQYEVQELNLISRLAEWVGMRHIVSAFLALRNGDPNDEDWIWQLRILCWWVMIRSKDPSSSIRLDLLAVLINKAKKDFQIFPPLKRLTKNNYVLSE